MIILAQRENFDIIFVSGYFKKANSKFTSFKGDHVFNILYAHQKSKAICYSSANFRLKRPEWFN